MSINTTTTTTTPTVPAPADNTCPVPESTVRGHVRRFLRDAAEAAVYIYVILLVTDKPVDFAKIARIASLIGVIQAVLHHLDQGTRDKIREGMTFSLGSSLIGGF